MDRLKNRCVTCGYWTGDRDNFIALYKDLGIEERDVFLKLETSWCMQDGDCVCLRLEIYSDGTELDVPGVFGCVMYSPMKGIKQWLQ